MKAHSTECLYNPRVVEQREQKQQQKDMAEDWRIPAEERQEVAKLEAAILQAAAEANKCREEQDYKKQQETEEAEAAPTR